MTAPPVLAASYAAVLICLWPSGQWKRLPAFTAWIATLLVGLTEYAPLSPHWRQSTWFWSKMIGTPLVAVAAMEAYFKAFEGFQYAVKLSIHLAGLGIAAILVLLCLAHTGGWVTSLNEILRYIYIGSWISLVLAVAFRSGANLWQWNEKELHLLILMVVYGIQAAIGMIVLAHDMPAPKDWAAWDARAMLSKAILWLAWSGLVGSKAFARLPQTA